jgi:hypothetical protein
LGLTAIRSSIDSVSAIELLKRKVESPLSQSVFGAASYFAAIEARDIVDQTPLALPFPIVRTDDRIVPRRDALTANLVFDHLDAIRQKRPLSR